MILELINKDRQRQTPDAPGTFDFSCKAQDQVDIHGWAWRGSDASNGTLFLLHGITSHSGNTGTWKDGMNIGEKFGLGVISFDFRCHGRSGNKEVTLGTAEMWDLQAVMGKAEELMFAKPFILSGDSLGAMAAQRTAISDGRVAGAILKNTPAWPWHALGASLLALNPLAGQIINVQYGWDILSDGDIRRQPPTPQHRPCILYIMGDSDHFDHQKTLEVYRHWYAGDTTRDGGVFHTDQIDACMASIKTSDARKWFVIVPGAGHPGNSGATPSIWEWPGYGQLINTFVSRCLGR